MSEAKNTKSESTQPESTQPLSQEQAAEVAGGDGTCTTTLNAGIITTSGPTVQETVINAYEGLVESTSYIIERVAGSMK